MSYAEVKNEVSEKKLTSVAVLMCALGAIFYCYEYYLRVAPSVMSAELKDAFSLSEAGFGNLAACYYYAYAPLQIPVGLMLDRFGARKILTLACLICALGTLAFAGTNNVTIAQIGRFFVGFGSAFAYVGVLKLSNVWLPKRYFALMAGITTALGMFGAMFGELSMAYMVGTMGWQSTLYYATIVGILLTILLWLVLQSEPKETYTTDSTHVSLWKGLWDMIINSKMWINGLIGCLLFLPISVFAELWAVPYLEAAGYSKSSAALGSSMVFLGFAIGGPVWGIISDSIKSRRIPILLGSLFSAIFMLILLKSQNFSVPFVYGLLFLSSFAASAQVLVFAVSNDINPSNVSGTAAAFTNMVVMVGGMLLMPIIGWLLDRSLILSNGMPMNRIQDFSDALLILPIALAISGLLCFALSETYKSHR